MSFIVAGVNLSSLPLFGKDYPDSWFHINQDGKLLTPEEWVKNNNGESISSFYDKKRDILNAQYIAVQNLKKTAERRTKGNIHDFGFSLPTMTSYVGTLNKRAVKQVLGEGVVQKWEEIAKMIAGPQGSAGNHIYGLDLETIGNIEKGIGPFGITEVGFSEYKFPGNGEIGEVISKEKGYGAFAVGISKEVRDFLKEALDLLENTQRNPEGFLGLPEVMQQGLLRASMYGVPGSKRYKVNGNAPDYEVSKIFNINDKDLVAPIFDQTSSGKYITVKKLSSPSLEIGQIYSGIDNLFTIGQKQRQGEYKDPRIAIARYLVKLSQETNNYYYGANSEYDITSLINELNKIKGSGGLDGDSLDDIDNIVKGLKKIRSEILDVVYLPQAAAEAHRMDVGSFIEKFFKEWSGVAMEQQLRFTGLGGLQAHESFSDNSNEGKTLHFWAKRLDELFEKKPNESIDDSLFGELKKRIKTLDTKDALLHIKYGSLDFTEGKEFGIVPAIQLENGQIANNGKINPDGRLVPNVPIAGGYYRIDPYRTGILEINENGEKKQKYYVTFADEADAISHKHIVDENGNIKLNPKTKKIKSMKEINATRFVLTGDTEEEITKKFMRIFDSSDVVISVPFDKNESKLEKHMVTEKQIIRSQASKRIDQARRQFEKLISASDVKIQSEWNLDTVYGYESLSKIIDLIDDLTKQAKQAYDAGDFEGKYDRLFVVDESTKNIHPAKYYDQTAISQLEKAIINLKGKDLEFDRYGSFKINYLRSRYEVESFLGLKNIIADEFELHKTLREQLSKAFGEHDYSLSDNIRMTAAYKDVYEYTKKLLAERFLPKFNGIEVDIDKYGVDFIKTVRSVVSFNKTSKGVEPFLPKGVESYHRINFSTLESAVSGINRLLNNINREDFVDILHGENFDYYRGLVSRKLLTPDQAVSLLSHYDKISLEADKRSGDISRVANELAIDIYENMKANPNATLTYEHLGEKGQSLSYIYIDEDENEHILNTSQAFAKLSKEDKKLISERIAKHASIEFYDVKSTVFDVDSELGLIKNSEGQNIIDQILTHINANGGGATSINEKKKIIAQMFSPTGGGKKSYSIGAHQKEGLQAIVMIPEQIGENMHEGNGAYIILTNKKHSGHVLELTQNTDIQNAASKSYGRLMNTELADHGIIIELPHIHKRIIDEAGNAIYSVSQGENFEKIILPYLNSSIKDGKMSLYFNDPEYAILNLYRKVGAKLLDFATVDDFRKGSKYMRKEYNTFLSNMPSFSSYFGSKYVPLLTPNDIMHGYEVRLHETLEKLFTHFVRNNGKEIDEFNLNPAQQLVMDFAYLHSDNPSKLKPRKELFENIMASSSWQEFLKRRMVTGKITDEPWIFDGKNQASITWENALKGLHGSAYTPKDANYRFDVSIYTLIKQLATDEHYSELVNIKQNKQALSNIPDDVTLINPILSESQTENGSYTYARRWDKTGVVVGFAQARPGDYAVFSGLNDMMRPLYIQQGNPLVYHFNPNDPSNSDIDMSLFRLVSNTITSDDGKEINILPITFGKNAIESAEYEARQALSKYNHYDPLDLEHDFIVRTKTVNPVDYVATWAGLRDQYASIIKEYKQRLNDTLDESAKKSGIIVAPLVFINEEAYKDIIDVMLQETSSIYQDKAMISPALAQQKLFQIHDGYNLKIDWTDVDAKETFRILYDLQEKKQRIDYGDVIGIRKHDGTRIYHTHANVLFDKEALQRVKDTYQDEGGPGKVRLEVIDGDIEDTKIMLYGTEKQTAHSVNLELVKRTLRKYNATASEEKIAQEAYNISTFLFDKASDGALIVVNPGYAKHGTMPAAKSFYDLVTSHYSDEGRVQDIVNIFNEYSGLTQKFRDAYDIKGSTDYMKTHRIVGNTSNAKNQIEFIEWIQNRITSNANNASDPNNIDKRIMAEYTYNLTSGMSYASAHRQIMNDHLGGQLLIDRRLEQAIALRGHTRKDGIQQRDVDWVRMLKRYALNYDGNYKPYLVAQQRSGEELKDAIIRNARNRNSRSFNHERFNYGTKARALERTLSGITEAYDYFKGDIGEDYIDSHNIIKISLDDLRKIKNFRVDSGINLTNDELMQTIFFIDDKPSKYLQHKALEIGINPDLIGSYTFYLDFGTKVNIDNGEEVTGVLLPFVNVQHITEGKTLYEEQPKKLAKFIRKAIEHSTKKDAGSLITSSLKEYMEDIILDTDIFSKDSTMFKVMQEYVAPNSAEFLAQDLGAPLFTDYYSKEIKINNTTIKLDNIVHRNQEIETQIAKNGLSLRKDHHDKYVELLEEYTKNSEIIQKAVQEDADEIASIAQKLDEYNTNIPTKYKDLATLGRKYENLYKISNTEEYLPSVIAGINERGFQRMGFNFGDIASDLITDYELYGLEGDLENLNFEGFKEFILDGYTSEDRMDRAKLASEYIPKKARGETYFEAQVRSLRQKDGILNRKLHETAFSVLEEIGSLDPSDKNLIENLTPYFYDIVNDMDLNVGMGAGRPTLTELVTIYTKQVQDVVMQTPRAKQNKFVNVEFTTRGINNKIADRINDTFREVLKETKIGQQYMQSVGTFAEFVRFPIFRSEGMVRLVLDESANNGQVRISNPIMTLITNVDFDGDKIFLASIANGTSIIPNTTREFETLRDIYDNFLKTDAPLLLAEALKSGDAFKFDNPEDIFKQEAFLFEKVDADNFQKAAIEYAKNEKYIDKNITNSDELEKLLTDLRKNPGFELGLLHSKEVSKAFKETVGNTTDNPYSQVAAIVARYRKQNIGYVSTPAFRLRETIFDVLQSKSLNDEEKSLLNNLMADLTSIDSKSGGLLSIAEQTSIDPKHAKDSLLLTRVTEFAQNAYSLISHFSPDKIKTLNEDKQYLVGIMNAIGNKTMPDINPEDYKEIVDKFIINMSHKDLQKNLDTGNLIKFKGTTVNRQSVETILALNRLYEASTTIFKVGEVYNNIIKGRSYKNIRDFIKAYGSSLTEAQLQTVFDSYSGTVLNPDNIANWTRRTSPKSIFKNNELYFMIGSKENGYEDEIYRYNASENAFYKAIKDNDGKYVDFQEQSTRVQRRKLKPVQSNLGYRMFLEDSETQRKILEKISSSKTQRMLDYVTINDEAVNYKGISELDIEKISDNKLKAVFTLLIPEGEKDKIKSVIDVYNYISSQTDNIDKTAAELLRQMNERITSNVDKITSGVGSSVTGFTLSPLSELYKIQIKNELRIDDDVFDSYKSFYDDFIKHEGHFNFDKYLRHVDFLQRNSYDISSTAKILNEAYSDIEETLKLMDTDSFDAKYLKNILKDKEDKIKSVIASAMNSNNITIFATSQQSIFDMFESNFPNTSMMKFFKWGSKKPDEQIVGFGTYFGKSFSSLSKGDIDIIREEADWFNKNGFNVPGASSSYKAKLNFAIDKTIDALKTYEPLNTESAFEGAKRIAFYDAVGTFEALDAVKYKANVNQNIRDESRKYKNTVTNLYESTTSNNNNFKRQTLSGTFFEQAQEVASKLTAQQIGAGIAALAGIGFVNKLLHGDDRRSPLEAGRSGAKQPPVINGNQIESSSGAPLTPGFGRTVYHDKSSGLNFNVSAKTKQRLSAINGAQAINLAGGGDAQVYAFNDTSRVSDNWLANKFAELAE